MCGLVGLIHNTLFLNMRIFIVIALLLLSACNAPDLNGPGKVSKSTIDEHGVVCYTSIYKGEFSCVKVK